MHAIVERKNVDVKQIISMEKNYKIQKFLATFMALPLIHRVLLAHRLIILLLVYFCMVELI